MLSPSSEPSQQQYPSLEGPNEDGVFVMLLGVSENRFSIPYFKKYLSCLETVEEHEGPTALVITGGHSKFFSNGLSFEALTEDATSLLKMFHRVLLETLVLGVPTVAAVNGHAFAGGAMIAFCCDVRVMNNARGYICVNEVEIGLPLTPGLAAIVQSKSDRSEWSNLMLQAKRYGGSEAKRYSLVDEAVEPDNVLPCSLRLAASLASKGENKSNYRNIKRQVYAAEVSCLSASAMGYAQGIADMMGQMAKL